MGNIYVPGGFTGAPIPEMTEVVPEYIMSTDPSDLRTRALAAIAAQADLGNLVWDISLGGAGAGHSFLSVVNFYTPADPETIETDLIVYMAASPEELSNAYAVALDEFRARNAGNLSSWLHYGHTVVGSSDGHRFMGLALAQIVTGPG